MADKHKKAKNYKSAWVYYSEAKDRYEQAHKKANDEELKDELRTNLERVEEKVEECKFKYMHDRAKERIEMDLSKDVKTFGQLSLKEQKHVLDNIKIYKELANKYNDEYGKTKDNQLLHAVFASNREAAIAYILGSKHSNDDLQCKQWFADGKKILINLEKLK